MRAVIAGTISAELDAEVDVCADGVEALRFLPTSDYDLVVTDINMPQINGLELIQFLKNNPRHQNTPIVIISSDGQARDRQRGLSLGANGYVVKPFEPQDLIDVIKPLLGD